MKFQTVPDTNVILATNSENPKSPNREYYNRWLDGGEFDLLYSDDTLTEYFEKLNEYGFPKDKIRAFFVAIMALGIEVKTEYFHLSVYPEDPDDVAFVLCAENGNATHLISYDHHILDLKHRHEFSFKICKMIEFLQELRGSRVFI